MTISPSDSRIFGQQFNQPDIAKIFSDEQYVHEMLVVEAALARVLGNLNVIPTKAADEIAKASAELEVDYDQLREGVSRSGFPVIDLVRQLRADVEEDVDLALHPQQLLLQDFS